MRWASTVHSKCNPGTPSSGSILSSDPWTHHLGSCLQASAPLRWHWRHIPIPHLSEFLCKKTYSNEVVKQELMGSVHQQRQFSAALTFFFVGCEPSFNGWVSSSALIFSIVRPERKIALIMGPGQDGCSSFWLQLWRPQKSSCPHNDVAGPMHRWQCSVLETAVPYTLTWKRLKVPAASCSTVWEKEGSTKSSSNAFAT